MWGYLVEKLEGNPVMIDDGKGAASLHGGLPMADDVSRRIASDHIETACDVCGRNGKRCSTNF